MLDKCHKGERWGLREGGEFAQGGQNHGLGSQIWGEKPPFNVFNLIAMSNGEETTIVGPLPLTFTHPTNQREEGTPPRVGNSKLVTCLLGGGPLGLKFVLGT